MVHVPLMFLSEWCEFPLVPCLAWGKKKNLMTARVSMLLKSRASPYILPFSLCNKKRHAIRHMNRSLIPTTVSIPSYDIGKYVWLRTYQHLLVERLQLIKWPISLLHHACCMSQPTHSTRMRCGVQRTHKIEAGL